MPSRSGALIIERMDERGPADQGPEPTQPLDPETTVAARRPLRRSASDRVIAGVAGGIADYLGVSSLAVRSVFGLAVVVIAFQIWTLLGLALVAYALLWIFVPREDVGVSPAGRLTQRFPRVGPAIGALILLAGAAAIAAQLESWLIWPVLLIGGGILLYRFDAGRAPSSTASVATPTPGSAKSADATPGAAMPDSPPTAVPTPPPRPPRERSPLGWLALGIAFLVVGVAAILQNLGALDIRLVRYPAVVLVILGVTMLVGAFVGRARWLALPALLVVPIVLATSMITVPLEGGVGNLYANPQTSTAVHGSYRRVAGDIYLDLSQLTGTRATPVVSASTAIGTVSVTVPFDAHVTATGTAGTGAVHIGKLSTNTTIDATLSTTMQPRLGDGATITLDLETGLGDIWVRRQGPTRQQLRELREAR